MKVVTAAQMREIDRRAAVEFLIPGIVLMEAAGIALARACADEVGDEIIGAKIAIFCGSGNNGGDGYVAARHLASSGAEVTIFATAARSILRGDAAAHASATSKFTSIRHVDVSDEANLNLAETGPYRLFVDCIVGTGARVPLTGLLAEVVTAVNEYAARFGVPVLSCDLPSGVDADSGKASKVAIRASGTVTFALPKPGLLVYPGSDLAGKLTVASIGLPPELLRAETEPNLSLVTRKYVSDLLPSRTETRDANKGSFGTLLVIAGSAGMAGACALTAISALRAGVGLVMLAVPSSLIDTAAALAPEAVLRALPETPDRTHGGPGALEAALVLAEKADAVALGPGMSGNNETVAFVKHFVQQVQRPVIIDADGLNAIAGSPEVISGRGPAFPTVLTPHPGEMGRLLDIKTGDVQADRFAAVTAGAKRYNAVVLLKGSRTLIGSAQGQIAINRRGTAALATAGSGDILTGVIGAYLAQNLGAFDAASTGAYVHALAGETAASSLGSAGVIAGDVRDHLPLARRRLYAAENLDEI